MKKRGLFTLFFLIFTLIILAIPAWAAQPAVPEGFLDYGTDKNNNGTFDHLSADLTINVNEPGEYRVAGEILVRKNLNDFETIAFTSFDINLAKGVQLVTIHFPGGEILKKGKDGPYFLNLQFVKGSWKGFSYLGETRHFKASEFEESDEIITSGKVTRKSQAIALVEAKAQELSLKLGKFQSLSFNGQWNIVYANPASQEPFKFIIGSDGVVNYLGTNPPDGGQGSPPEAGINETPTPVESTTEEPGEVVADPNQVTEDKAEVKEEVKEVKEEPAKAPEQEKAPAEPRGEKEGKLDKPGNVPVWPFVVSGFVLFLLLGFISEIKARYR